MQSKTNSKCMQKKANKHELVGLRFSKHNRIFVTNSKPLCPISKNTREYKRLTSKKKKNPSNLKIPKGIGKGEGKDRKKEKCLLLCTYCMSWYKLSDPSVTNMLSSAVAFLSPYVSGDDPHAVRNCVPQSNEWFRLWSICFFSGLTDNSWQIGTDVIWPEPLNDEHSNLPTKNVNLPTKNNIHTFRHSQNTNPHISYFCVTPWGILLANSKWEHFVLFCFFCYFFFCLYLFSKSYRNLMQILN